MRRLFPICVVIFLLFAPVAPLSADPPPFASDLSALTTAFPGGTVESLGDGECALVVPGRDLPAPVADPYYGWRFPAAAYLYARRFAGDTGRSGLVRLVTVYHEPSDGIRAQHTARLLARLLLLFRSHFKRSPVFGRGGDAAAIYLTHRPAPEKSDVGGKTRENQVYLFDTNASRTSLEWARTVLHEWGHLTLPTARGYVTPENDAAGFLGERLFFKWLREENQATAAYPDDDIRQDDLNLYHRRQIAPLIAEFEKGGTDSRQFDSGNTGAMDYYIGAVLASDTAFGSEKVADALWGIADVRPRSFLAALRSTLGRAAKGNVSVHLPAWVPLAGGVCELRPDPPTNGGSLAIADRPPLVLPSRVPALLTVRVPGWKWMRSPSGLTRILLHRQTRAKSND